MIHATTKKMQSPLEHIKEVKKKNKVENLHNFKGSPRWGIFNLLIWKPSNEWNNRDFSNLAYHSNIKWFNENNEEDENKKRKIFAIFIAIPRLRTKNKKTRRIFFIFI